MEFCAFLGLGDAQCFPAFEGKNPKFSNTWFVTLRPHLDAPRSIVINTSLSNLAR